MGACGDKQLMTLLDHFKDSSHYKITGGNKLPSREHLHVSVSNVGASKWQIRHGGSSATRKVTRSNSRFPSKFDFPITATTIPFPSDPSSLIMELPVAVLRQSQVRVAQERGPRQ